MAVTYTQADDDVMKLLRRMMREHHQELDRARVTVCVLMADSDDPEKPPVVLRGRRAYAIARADARIEIDAPEWQKLTELQQLALLDHELEHLEVCYEQDSTIPKRDTADRPKLRMRLHDVEIGIFTDVVRRHGQISLDAIAVRKIADSHGQLLMPWEADVAKKNAEARPAGDVIGRIAGGVADRAAEVMKVPDGVESMTITAAGKSVTLTKDGARRRGAASANA